MGRELQNINIVIIGHVDSGKSTTAGHLLYESGCIDRRTLDLYESESLSMGRGSFKYAYILDLLKAERERGISIDVSLRKLCTSKYMFTLIDTPGHKDYIKNMILGTSQADVGLLIVSSISDEFNIGMSATGQTKEHILLSYTFGIKQMICCINKLDVPDINYSRDRFYDIKFKIADYLFLVGYNPDNITFIPISGWIGDNLTEKSLNTPWYEGGTLLQTLDNITPPKRLNEGPLRIPVYNIFKISNVGTIICGFIQSGKLINHREIICAPTQLISEVQSIEIFHESVSDANAGDYIGFHVPYTSQSVFHKGYVFGDPNNKPPVKCHSFDAKVIITNHPNIKDGYSPIINCHTAHIVCRFTKLRNKTILKHGNSNNIIEYEPTSIKTGDCCEVTLIPTKDMVVEKYTQFKSLGRFSIRDMSRIIGVGIITKVNITA